MLIIYITQVMFLKWIKFDLIQENRIYEQKNMLF